VGQSKVEVMARRLLDINPELIIHAHHKFFTPHTEGELLGSSDQAPRFDVLVDAIDHTERKSLLIESCIRRDIPVVTCGAAGGRSTPQLVTRDDLSRSTHDGLLRKVKRALRRGSVLTEIKSGDRWGVPAVFSTERAIYPDGDGGVCHTSSSHEALRLNCDIGFGSLSLVTGTFGFVAASAAIELVLQNAPQSLTLTMSSRSDSL
jgi:tRNA A37 threonylcarbamoyladenosine dehydratase